MYDRLQNQNIWSYDDYMCALSFYWSKIILVEYQSFRMGSIHFGWAQFILDRSKSYKLVQKSLIWTWPKWFGPDPKWFGPDQNNLDLYPSKTIWAVQNLFGPIEGQGSVMYIVCMMSLCYFKSPLRYNNQGNIFNTLLFVEGQCLFKSSLYLDKAMHSNVWNVWNVYFLFNLFAT